MPDSMGSDWLGFDGWLLGLGLKAVLEGDVADAKAGDWGAGGVEEHPLGR